MNNELINTPAMNDNNGSNEIAIGRKLILAIYTYTMSKVAIVNNTITIFYN
jgi:hypothetical protein